MYDYFKEFEKENNILKIIYEDEKYHKAYSVKENNLIYKVSIYHYSRLSLYKGEYSVWCSLNGETHREKNFSHLNISDADGKVILKEYFLNDKKLSNEEFKYFMVNRRFSQNC